MLLTVHSVDFWFKAIEEEMPGIRGRVIEASSSIPLKSLLSECEQGCTSIRYINDQRYQLGMQSVSLDKGEESDPSKELSIKGHVVLISGGAGGLGYVFAKYMAKHWGVHPVLVGRSPANDDIVTKINTLRRYGVEAVYLSADIADADKCRRLYRKIELRYGRLDGIIHAAGVNRDAVLLDQTEDGVSTVLSPKVAGTDQLIDMALQAKVSWFTGFASISGFLGNPGQSDYSFANAYLDASLDRLSEKGIRSKDMAWNPCQLQPDWLCLIKRCKATKIASC